MKQCPCGTDREYSNCCGLYIDEGLPAGSPETLMRSRYCAYTMANIAYVQKTMLDKALNNFDPKDAKRWARHVDWIGLRVLKVIPDHENKGFVEFIATFRDMGVVQSIHEISEFKKIDNRWFYVDGILL